MSLSVDFVDWKDIAQYAKYKSLLTVNLGDDVTVEYNPFDINVKLRVCTVSYNCLTDKYETLTIGKKKISVVNTINEGTQKIDDAVQEVIVATQKASAIMGDISDLNSDSKLTPNEKHAALREWSAFANEKTSLSAQAAAFGISDELTVYNNTFMLLSNYLNNGALYTTGIPSWLDGANLEITTNISGTIYRQMFTDYYAARNVLPQYYYEDTHPAIVDKSTWECVQLEFARQEKFILEHKMKRSSENMSRIKVQKKNINLCWYSSFRCLSESYPPAQIPRCLRRGSSLMRNHQSRYRQFQSNSSQKR